MIPHEIKGSPPKVYQKRMEKGVNLKGNGSCLTGKLMF